MITMHALICRNADKWATYVRAHASLPWDLVEQHASGRLQEAIEASFSLDPAQTNWTFSERQAADVTTAYLVERPKLDHIAVAARGLTVNIYCPEGRIEGPDDRWAQVNVDGGQLWSGLDWVFRPQTLRPKIIGYFGFEKESVWKTFVGGKLGIDRPHMMRELWVRPTWRARKIAEGFPEFRPWPTQTAQVAAR